MDLQEFLDRMNSGAPITNDGDLHHFMHEITEEALRLTAQLNNTVVVDPDGTRTPVKRKSTLS